MDEYKGYMFECENCGWTIKGIDLKDDFPTCHKCGRPMPYTTNFEYYFKKDIIARSFMKFCSKYNLGSEKLFSMDPLDFYRHFFSLDKYICEDVIALYNKQRPKYYLYKKNAVNFKINCAGEISIEKEPISQILTQYESYERKNKVYQKVKKIVLSFIALPIIIILGWFDSEIDELLGWSVPGLIYFFVGIFLYIFIGSMIDKRKNRKEENRRSEILKTNYHV